ncbi:hypothetical protein AJ78_08705 [Emergomyces pasteurianus Ep9510]|uniref:Uncharacterized protein n=1 Tax=Emergomyces pasteurianus Ep9510 TaxID=1447872 RepID=A0A1J9P035_9EURO|nr:hypothetical protein AJ78_08705 [Emergomyces pasteurianus Ep9510]
MRLKAGQMAAATIGIVGEWLETGRVNREQDRFKGGDDEEEEEDDDDDDEEDEDEDEEGEDDDDDEDERNKKRKIKNWDEEL